MHDQDIPIGKQFRSSGRVGNAKLRIVTSSLEYPPLTGGVGINAMNCVAALRDLGYEVCVPKAEEWIALPNLVPLRLVKWELLMRRLDVTQLDVLWLHDPLVLSKGIWRKISAAGASIVVTFHTPLFHLAEMGHPYGALGDAYYEVFRPIEIMMMRELQKVGAKLTAVSPLLAAAFEREFGFEISFILPPAPTVGFTVDKESSRRSLVKFGIPIDALLLISVGRFWDKRKNLPLLLSFFRQIENRIPGTYLILQGTSSMKVDNHVVHLPFDTDKERLARVYQAADAFVSMSTTESMPMSVLDAVNFNLKLILSDIPAHKWIIDQNGGLLIPLQNPGGSISSVIEYLLAKRKATRLSSPRGMEWREYVLQHLSLIADGKGG